jgi:hypothetical protein
MVGSWWFVVSLWFAGGAFFVVEKSDRLLRFIFGCVGLGAKFEGGLNPMSEKSRHGVAACCNFPRYGPSMTLRGF